MNMRAISALALAGAGTLLSMPCAAADDGVLGQVELLDQRLFAAYNACDLDAFSSLFAPDVEFYHDTGGVTHTREEVIRNTRQYICGKVRRELVAGTLKAYPIKDFGAIAVGEHHFCELATGRCDGIAQFVIVWRETAGSWVATRVLSFGHRASP